MPKENNNQEKEEEAKEIPKEITPVEEEAPKRWCSVCGRYVNVRGKKKNICVNCGSFTAKYKPEDKPEEEIKEDHRKKGNVRKEYKMTSLRPANLSGRELATAEILINAGVAKSFNDLVRKGIDVMYRSTNLPTMFNPNNKMENSEKQEANPKKLRKELIEDRMLNAYVKSMEQGDKGDPLQMMMLMRMMGDMETGKNPQENNFMDKLMQLQMMKSMGSQDNSEVQNLQGQLADLKYQMQTQQLLQNSQQKGTSLQDQMIALEKIRGERDKEIKEKDVQLQKERDQNLKGAMEQRVKDIEEKVVQAQQGGGLSATRLQQFREELRAIKEMSNEIGAREKGAGEYVSETIGNVATQLQPALTKLIEKKEQRAQPMPPELVQAPMPAQPEPQPQPQNPSAPSELTPSEKQMSDQMSDMYLKSEKK